MNRVSAEAQNIVLSAAEPTFPGERVSVQKRRAYQRLRLHQVPAGDSKLHNAWNGRAGWPTLQALQEQAEKTGLLKRNITGPCHDGAEHLQRLRDGAERLRRIDPEYGDAYSAALESILRAVERRAG